jgi:hypothetical protein
MASGDGYRIFTIIAAAETLEKMKRGLAGLHRASPK